MKFHLRTKDDDKTLKEVDQGLLKVVKEVSRDRKKIWTSAELRKLYLDDNDNVIYVRRTFIQKLLNYFNGDLIPFTNPCYLSWIAFKDHAMAVFKDAKDKDKEGPVERVGHIIAKECKKIDLVKDTYTTRIDTDRAINQVSPTSQQILKDISPIYQPL